MVSPNLAAGMSYGASNLVGSIAYSSHGSTVASFTYGRDSMGIATVAMGPQGTESYSYDANYYLSSVSYAQPRFPASTGPDQEVFNYDPLGNRITDKDGNYQYDQTGQRLLEDYRYRYTYDGNGNLQSRLNKATGQYEKFSYSSENQLVKIQWFETELSTVPIKQAFYQYDAIGRRVEKRVIDDQNALDVTKTFTRRYAYDGNEILIEFDGANHPLARYTHSTLRTDDALAIDVTQAGVDQKLATATGTYSFIKDALGSIREITDSSGAVIQHNVYSAYGELVSVQNASGQDITSSPLLTVGYAFTGREFDRESGLYYYRARYYDASIGRFLQQDPNPGNIGDPGIGSNKFSYGRNCPTSYIDPTGKIAWFIAIPLITSISGALAGGIYAAIEGRDIGSAVFTGAWQGLLIGGGAVAGIAIAGGGAAIGGAAASLWGAAGSGLVGGSLGVANNKSNPGSGFIMGATFGALTGLIAGAGILPFFADLTQGAILSGPPLPTPPDPTPLPPGSSPAGPPQGDPVSIGIRP